MFYPIIQSQENYIVVAAKAIIEIHIAAKQYLNYSERIIKKTKIRVHYTT